MSSIALRLTSSRRWVREALLIALGSIFLGLMAPLSFQVPFTPVPFCMAGQIVLLLGASLGARSGALAVIAYLLQGAVGLPVFAGGAAGFIHLLGPTGGYLFGYIAAAYVTGYLIEKDPRPTHLRRLGAFAVGNLAIFLFGAAYLSLFIGFKSAIMLGVLPFLVTDALKCLLVYRSAKSLIW